MKIKIHTRTLATTTAVISMPATTGVLRCASSEAEAFTTSARRGITLPLMSLPGMRLRRRGEAGSGLLMGAAAASLWGGGLCIGVGTGL